MAEICGTTPDASVLRRKMSAYPPSESDTFLNARAAGVVEADDRRAHLDREVHDLDDLGGVGFGERSAEDGEVLREGVDEAAIDAAVAGDDAVAGHDLIGHAEVAATVRDERVGFFEACRDRTGG